MKNRRMISILIVALVFLLTATSAVSARTIPGDGENSHADELIGVALSNSLSTDKPSVSKDCSCCDKTSTSMNTISINDPVLESLKQTPEATLVKDNLGELLWDQSMVQLHVIEDKPWQILAVPILNTNATEVQIMLAATEDGSQFRILAFGMQRENSEIDKHQSFSGTLKFYSPDGNLLISALYSDGKLQSIEDRTNEISPMGLNWGCFGECLITMGYDLYYGCYTVCNICASTAAIPYNPYCLACAGCYGIGVFACIISCSDS